MENKAGTALIRMWQSIVEVHVDYLDTVEQLLQFIEVLKGIIWRGIKSKFMVTLVSRLMQTNAPFRALRFLVYIMK